ncbi:MAG TPA: gas vesicle protein GvpJ [Gemmatimonadaceae bacterium]
MTNDATRALTSSNDVDEIDEEEQLILGDLLNHVLDKGVVISGTVTISVADIDLLMLDLRLLLTSVETSLRRGIERSMNELIPGTDAGRAESAGGAAGGSKR